MADGLSVKARFFAAVDERRNDPAILTEALEKWDNRALAMWGLLGQDACPAIRPYLTASEDVASHALRGLTHCRDTESYSTISEIARSAEFSALRSEALEALGFTTTEENRADHVVLVAGVLDSDKSDSEKAAAIYGLMQSITYAGLTPGDLPGLDFQKILSLAGQPGKLGFEAAYLLIRLQGLDAVFEPDQVNQMITPALPVGQAYLLTRVLGQLGAKASWPLITIASRYPDEDPIYGRVAVSAIRALGNMKGPQSRHFLPAVLMDAPPGLQHVALTALMSREDTDAAVEEQVRKFVDEDNNPWLAVTALERLAQKNDEKALETAVSWLADGSFYKAFRAISILSGSEEGRAMLQAYLDKARDPVRARLVQATLDPAAVPVAPVRPTVPYVEAAASDGELITLTTTRGDIVIELLEGAPYAGHAFLSLAGGGSMDGMIWHRVIPGFVAQAGQIDDMRQFEHGTIREEWNDLSHKPGTVGVATAGPDTGSSQFFINLEHNRHLDGRYTVIGHVVSGMDVAYALQEGDAILSVQSTD